jgi:23S rRNA (cytidine1920-2'-O)/16S rRNA (cytidine1409-2'-O)-methyltransferase
MVKAASLVAESAAIEVGDDGPEWASRGGLKLEAALDEFQLDVAAAHALDVGASTGGFTDVLLTRGAQDVTAVDVGYGQLVWRLRSDPRVTVFDRTNFRTVDVALLAPPFDVIVVDVSFISVSLLARQLAAVGRGGSDYVVLVKPQFEVGRSRVGRGGIVSDPDDHAAAIATVARALDGEHIGPVALMPSPIAGAKGNREFLLHGVAGAAATVGEAEIARTVGLS